MPRGRKPAFAAREAVCGVVCQFRFSPSPLQGAARGDISANRRICAKAFRQCTRLLRIVRLKLLAVVLNRVSRKARVEPGEAESRHDCAGVAAYGACAAACDIEAHGNFRHLRKFAAPCGRNGAPPAVEACKLCAAALTDENFGGQYASKPEKWLPPPSVYGHADVSREPPEPLCGAGMRCLRRIRTLDRGLAGIVHFQPRSLRVS